MPNIFFPDRLIVDKIRNLVWLERAMPIDVLRCLADQLLQYLDVFWQSLYAQHIATGAKPNTITYWYAWTLPIKLFPP